MTERQKVYIESLLDQREMTDDARAAALAQLSGLDKARASRWIERLKSLPLRTSPLLTAAGERVDPPLSVEYLQLVVSGRERTYGLLKGGANPVPRGSYAVETPEDPHNKIKFYQVWISDKGSHYGDGKWRVSVQHGDEEHALKDKTKQEAIVRKIAEDPNRAAEMYGLHIGRCGICGRRLTNQESRERGIGPICAGRYGW